MTTAFIILLIISQLICFYVIFIMNAKMAKLQDVEQRQNQLMREMENTFSVYLLEMKEENDRFLNELSSISPPKAPKTELDAQLPKSTNEQNPQDPSTYVKVVPKSVVQKAYKQQSRMQDASKEEETTPSLSAKEEQILSLHREGKTIEEIAKITQKGKTEIELFIKFHS